MKSSSRSTGAIGPSIVRASDKLWRPAMRQRTVRWTHSVLLLLVTGSLLLQPSSPAFAQQDDWDQVPRSPPPPRSVVRMRKSIGVGSDQGHRVRLKGVEITDPRFNPFLIQITISGEKSLGIYKARFTSSFGTFETELPKEPNARWQFALANSPTSPDARMSMVQNEQRTFNISVDDAILLEKSEKVELVITGRLQERTYTIKPKQMKVLREWLAPRIAKYTAEANADG